MLIFISISFHSLLFFISNSFLYYPSKQGVKIPKVGFDADINSRKWLNQLMKTFSKTQIWSFYDEPYHVPVRETTFNCIYLLDTLRILKGQFLIHAGTNLYAGLFLALLQCTA